ncbi:hypothetical protein AB0D24_27970 [Streptomyces javensis]
MRRRSRPSVAVFAGRLKVIIEHPVADTAEADRFLRARATP